jgi:hypothetical protein
MALEEEPTPSQSAARGCRSLGAPHAKSPIAKPRIAMPRAARNRSELEEVCIGRVYVGFKPPPTRGPGDVSLRACCISAMS